MRHEITLRRVRGASAPGSHHWKATCTCGWESPGYGSVAKRQEEKLSGAHLRSTCPLPGKKAFNSREGAEQSLSTVLKRGRGGKLPSRSYQCKCGKWHLTSQPKRIRTGVAA